MTDPVPGDLCVTLYPFEVLSDPRDGTSTRSGVMNRDEVFLILSASEINEIASWEFEIMHKSSTFYFNIPAVQGMIDTGGEGGQYSFPFKRLKSDNKQARR